MASCSDLRRISSINDCRPITKATPVPIFTSKKLVEPFHRLKNRANLFRRKNYSSEIDISSHTSDHRSSLVAADHIIPSHQITTAAAAATTKINNNNVGLLKRSNSMICPQQRLETFLNHNNNNNHRNSICVELSSCPTDDYRFLKSSSNRYWNKKTYSRMSHIDEHEIFPLNESINEKKIEEISLLPNNNNEQASVILSSPQSTINVIRGEEQKQQLIPPVSSSSSSTVILRDDGKTIHTRRQSHSNITLLEQQPSICSTFDEPFYDCKQQTSPIKSKQHFDMSLSKISTCTMTGKSLNNLDECLSTTSSEEKGVQTIFNESLNNNNNTSCIHRANSSTSLSSSTSIQTDSLENKPKISILSKTDETTKQSINQSQTESNYKRLHIHERLLGEQTCIYWVNYLGSTAIKMSHDNTTAIPTHAITRLKQSTQYARVLPIIGLSISSRGVEFLKHTKDRVAICFHKIKSIHCACQDQDLRYFAYVTREQRLVNGVSHATTTFDHTQPSVSIGGDYHNYCHVFVVKNESMSTEIMLTFGQAFNIAYRLHRCLKSKEIYSDKSHPKIDVSRLSTKSNKVLSSSTHSPATSSSSSSIDERKIFV